MKKNIIRVIVVGLIGLAWLFYLHWNNNRIQNGPKAQKITCVNNLKQIGLAFRIWADDNQGKYPFNLSTNMGGTMELCAVDKDGFDTNTFFHFKALAGADYLSVPLLLVCPQDTTRKAAANWESLRPENISYRICSGTNITSDGPKQVLAICPIDGNTLYSDGTVVSKRQTGEDEPSHSLDVKFK